MSTPIRILPPALQNQIAAGEVVERPANVAKELIENSLDAGATRIHLNVENGGQGLIQVQDNGHGLAPGDIPMALTRHATSKLHAAADLERIASLGFRGEALPSIASVSRLSMASALPGEPAGHGVDVTFGEITAEGPVALQTGTRIQVRDLFSNTPARLKFLKTQATETRRCQEVFFKLALAHLDKEFTFSIQGRTQLHLVRDQDLTQRLASTWPRQIVEGLFPVQAERHGLQVEGMLGSPQTAQGRAQRILLYINGRPVQDTMLLRALREGYKGSLLSKEYPQAVLFLSLPLEEVEINVHPAQSEVRFRDERSIASLLCTAVRTALNSATIAPGASAPDSQPRQRGLTEQPNPKFGTFYDYLHNTESIAAPQAPAYPSASTSNTAPRPSHEPPGAYEGAPNSAPVYLGQVAGTYLVLDDGQGLLLIDQHAAHERVLFNAFRQHHGEVETQLLALPLELSLQPSELEHFQEVAASLREMGFSCELAQTTLLAVRAIPASLTTDQAKGLLRDILAGKERSVDAMRVVMACRSAIKAGDSLSRDEALQLLQAWQHSQERMYCPHGRPVAVRFAPGDLERFFKRGE